MVPVYWNQKKIWNEMEEYPEFFGQSDTQDKPFINP